MPFGPNTLAALETALSDGADYHTQLDSYLLRAGLDGRSLIEARAEAENKARGSARQWPKAPKRYVVKEVLDRLSRGGRDGEVVIANLITALCNGPSPEAPSAKEAVEALKRQRLEDRKEKEERQERARMARAEKQTQERTKADKEAALRAQARDTLLQQFFGMHAQSDHHARGFALERLLNELFALEELAPRGSFKIAGEQIDGAFSWRGQTHLVEARWRQEKVAGSGFAELKYKIEGKSADTRGLFVSITGYSSDGLQSLATKGSLRFVCIDGAHLIRALQPGGTLVSILTQIWRHAGETGKAYLPTTEM